jgi:CRP-like cAMP-binding protein
MSARLVSPLERILFLRGVTPLRRLSRKGLVEFADRLTERAFPRGSVLAVADEPIEHVFIIAEGRVAVDLDGTEEIVESGAGINILRLLGGHETGRRAVAQVDTVALELAAADLLSLLEANPSMLEANLRQFAAGLLKLRGDLPIGPGDTYVPTMGERPSGPIDLVQRLTVLEESSSVWKNANLDAVVTLARGMSEVHHPAGTPLWSTGDSAEFGLQLRYGKIECTSSDGRRVEVGAGFGLGFMDAMGGVPRAYGAVTSTEIVALRWEVDRFFAIIEAHPATGMRLLSDLARMFGRTWEQALMRGEDVGLGPLVEARL